MSSIRSQLEASMAAQQAQRPTAETIENVLINGDLEKLSPADRVSYYTRVCTSLGLNPLTKPFDYIKLSGRLTLYAKRDATEQLRKIHGVSITELTSQHLGDVFVVTAKAQDKTGRTDASTGAVAVGNLKGEALANALMKCETKAKRRVTLSLCGLGLLDETEVEAVAPPPAVVAEQPAALPPAPDGAVYLVQVQPQRKGERQWADVTLSTGEVVIAAGAQLVALLEQLVQERVPVWLETKQNRKGNTEIVAAHRRAPEPPAPVDELSADEIAF